MNGRTAIAALAAASVAALTVAIGPASASAAFSISSLETSLTHTDGATPPSTTNLLGAGAHPDLNIKLRFPDKPSPEPDSGITVPDGSLKQVDATLPAGLVVDPTVTSKCSTSDLLNGSPEATCSPDSQVGTVLITYASGASEDRAPIYNMATAPGVPARFGINVLRAGVFLDA